MRISESETGLDKISRNGGYFAVTMQAISILIIMHMSR